jgi:hypothetical protein
MTCTRLGYARVSSYSLTGSEAVNTFSAHGRAREMSANDLAERVPRDACDDERAVTDANQRAFAERISRREGQPNSDARCEWPDWAQPPARGGGPLHAEGREEPPPLVERLDEVKRSATLHRGPTRQRIAGRRDAIAGKLRRQGGTIHVDAEKAFHNAGLARRVARSALASSARRWRIAKLQAVVESARRPLH